MDGLERFAPRHPSHFHKHLIRWSQTNEGKKRSR